MLYESMLGRDSLVQADPGSELATIGTIRMGIR